MKFDKLNEKVSFVQEKLIEAKEYLKDYKKSSNKRDLQALERVVEQIVETSIKINKDLLKNKKLFPISYKESFLKLEIYDFFKKKDLESLSETATFRNELAHDYMTMNSFYSIENIEKIIQIYPKYLLSIIEFLEK